MVTASIWLGWCNSGKIFTCNELKGTTANGKTFDPPLCPNQSFWDQKAQFGLVEMTYFHRFSRTIHGVLKKTFCASSPVWFPHAHLFLESWKPGCIQIHVSWRTCLHSTHPRFRAFIIQWNSPCWLQGSWFTEKLSNTRKQRRQSLWSCGGKRASQQLQAAGE